MDGTQHGLDGLADGTGRTAAAGVPAPTVVECRGVWKLFGPKPRAGLAALRRDGLGKDEVLARHGCVVGVADASLAVARGETFCLMGLSGSGKSTLLRHVNGLVRPTEGQVLVEGEDVARKPARELRRLRAARIGMVFQSFALLPHRTVLDNAAFPLELRGIPRARREAAARETLGLVGLSGWEARWPDELSGGMQQRVGLARALAGDPDILLMDEPFGALDPLIRRQLQDQFLEIARTVRKTVLFVTHDLDEAIRLGSRIAIMRDGRIVQVGTPAEILRRPADDYVRAFAAGVPALRRLQARDVMTPLAVGAPPPGDLPPVAAGTSLGRLATLLARDGQAVVVDGDRRPIGTVDRAAVLASIGSGPDRAHG